MRVRSQISCTSKYLPSHPPLGFEYRASAPIDRLVHLCEGDHFHVFPRRVDRGFVHQVLELRAAEARRAIRDLLEADALGQRLVSDVNLALLALTSVITSSLTSPKIVKFQAQTGRSRLYHFR